MVELMSGGCLLSVRTDDWWLEPLTWQRPAIWGSDCWVVSGSTIYESWGLGFLGCFTRWSDCNG